MSANLKPIINQKSIIMKRRITLLLLAFAGFIFAAQAQSYEQSISKQEDQQREIEASKQRQQISPSVIKNATHAKDTTILMGDGTVTTCDASFYDSGGPTGDFANNEDFTLTVYPATAGSFVQVEFTFFDCGTQGSGWDFLEIYDGVDMSSTMIVSSDAVGNDGMLATFTATNTDGALTFHFQSTSVVPNPGWESSISCHIPTDHDMGVDAISPTTVLSGETVTPQVTIHNYGLMDESTWSVQLTATDGYDETVSDAATIVSGDDYTIDFPDWTPADGIYTLFATVTLAGDTIASNDTLSVECEVAPLGFGDVVMTFVADEAGCPGIETDGNYIYTVYWNSGSTGRYFSKYDMNGNYIEDFQITGVADLRDMAYSPSTGFFYGAAANASLFEMDFENQTLENTISIPTDSRAICYDDGNNTFWANNWDTPLTEFNPDGTATGNSFASPSIYGVAYDKWSDPANPTYWLFTGTATGVTPMLEEFASDGTPTGRTIDCSTAPGFDAGIAGGAASYEENGHAYILANLQQDPNLIVKFYLSPAGPPPPTYTVTFNVTDIETTDPIDGATIDIDGNQLTTDASGVATIDLYDGNYPYTVNATDYDEYTGDVTVAGAATSVDVEMTPTSVYYEVTFGVYDGDGDVTAAVSGTTISSGDTVAEGDTVWFYADPDDGFKTNDWYLNGTSTTINDDTVYYSDLDMDIDLQAEFIPDGVNEITSSQLKVYPNPSSNGEFTIDVSGKYEVSVMNIAGKVVYNTNINGVSTIDLSRFAEGLYFMQLKSEDKIITQKIMIQ